MDTPTLFPINSRDAARILGITRNHLLVARHRGTLRLAAHRSRLTARGLVFDLPSAIVAYLNTRKGLPS